MIINLESEHDIIVEPHSAVFFHDQQRGGLHSTYVPTSGLTGLQRGNQPLGEMPFCVFEGRDHVIHHGGTRQDVALRRHVAADPVTRPRR